MSEAGRVMYQFAGTISVHSPRIPVYSNVDGGSRPVTKAWAVRKNLGKQVVSQVKWEATMNKMFKERYADESMYPRVYECGPGDGSLCAMLRKVNGRAGKRAAYVEV